MRKKIQKLIILGLLKKGKFSGYDIRKLIEKELGVFSQVDTKSIYYPLNKMEGEGLIEKEKVETGKYPQKYVYSITPRGEKNFFMLCKEAIRSIQRPFIELDLALYFLPLMDKKEVLPLLKLRLRLLARVKQWLDKRKKEFELAENNYTLLLQHHTHLLKAEKEFISTIIETIK